MSWDIFVQDLPTDARTFEEIPEDFVPVPLGSRAAIIDRIKEVAPAADFSDPSWGHLDEPGFSIEFNMGNKEECRSFAFHVYGADAAAGVVAAILEHLKLRALDSQTGGFFEAGESARESLRRWRAYRDQIVKENR
jgi:hypothetical protein